MKSRDFCFWLQGFFELSNNNNLTEDQIKMIKSHLSLVFKHEIDPSMGNTEHQSILNQLHSASATDKDQIMRC